MSRFFDNSAKDYLEIDEAVVTGPPFTMACWFNTDDVANRISLMGLANSGAASDYFSLQCNGPNSSVIRAITISGGSSAAQTSTSYLADTWHLACGVFAATNDRRAFLDGGGKDTNSGTTVPIGVNRSSIGRIGDSSPSFEMSGFIAEAAIWDVALTDSEIAALYNSRINPRYMRSSNVVGYWPIWGIHSPEIDLSGQGRN